MQRQLNAVLTPTGQPLRHALVLALLALPWLHPWAPGPHPNTWPLLIAWGSALGVLLLSPRGPDAQALAQAWTCAALASAAIGLVQYFGLAPVFHGWVFAPGPLGEAMGNLRQRNQLATHLLIGAAGLLWWHRHGLRTRWALLGMGLLGAGLAATTSRTGLLGLLVLSGLYALWHRPTGQRTDPPWLRPWAALCAAYGLASLALPWALAGWSGSEVPHVWARWTDTSGSARTALWAHVLELIALRPWTGWGWDGLKYAQYITDFQGPRFPELMGNAHNLPLHLAVTLGLPVAAGLCGAAMWALRRARPWRAQRPETQMAWAVLAVVGLHSLLEYPLWFGPFQVACLWSWGLLWPALGQGWQGLGRGRTVLAGLALACGLWVLQDHTRMRQVYLPEAQRAPAWRADPWGAAQGSVLFADAVRFARLTTTPVTAENAPEMLALSLQVLPYSPEPRVVDKLIDSARLSGQDDWVAWHSERKRQMVWAAGRAPH